jgi:SprT protein
MQPGIGHRTHSRIASACPALGRKPLPAQNSAGVAIRRMLPAEATLSKVDAPPVPTAIRQKARECIARYVERANREQRIPLKMPTCSFDLRGTTAGRAYLGENHVQLNPVLLTENFESFLSDVIPHEVAHLAAYVKWNVRDHGEQWKSVMRAFGLKPNRCHSLDVSNSSTASVLYRHRCACKTHDLTPRTHPGALKGTRYCGKCKHTLQFTGMVKERGGKWEQVESASTTPPKPMSKHKAASRKPVGGFRLVFKTSPSTGVPPRKPVSPAVPTGSNAPTPAMLRYMQDLARALQWAVPAEALRDRRAASEFIDRAKTAKEARSAQSPTGQPQPAAPVVEAPTEKQLSYAQSIASRKKLTIPADVLASKRAISSWIDANK